MTAAFERLLGEASVLSLDVFDTVLGRRCARPEDVFLFMEEELTATHGEVFKGFARFRAEADAPARRRAWEERQAGEIGLDDLCRELLEAHPDWPVPAKDLAALEMRVESRLLYPLENGLRMFDAARSLGKRIVFTSDMYLPEAFCRERLEKAGFRGFHAFFLSSSVGKLKYSGKLFAHLVDALGVPPHEILHVGDNPHTDGTQARRAGLKTLLVPKAIDQIGRFERNPWGGLASRTSESTRRSLLLGLSALGCQRESRLEDPFWYRVGFQVGGPLVYGYVAYLIGQLRNRGINKVYFLSRDGYILKQVYERVRSGIPGCPDPDYLFASRRALNFASITDLDPLAMDWLAEGVGLTVGEFLKRISVPPERHLEAIRKAGFPGPEAPVIEGADYENLRLLFTRMKEPILQAARGEKAAYLAYLKKKGVTTARPLVLVDVGWMTSIQHSFEKMLSPEVGNLEIEGYYLGSYPDAARRAGPASRHSHYLMAYGAPAHAMDIIRHCVCLVEFFFAAPERTFIRMKRNPDGSLEPVFAGFHENEKDLAALREIHRGILEYAEEAVRAGGEGGLMEVTPQEVLSLLNRLLVEPNTEEAHRLGDLHYADGYGSYFQHSHMARPTGFPGLGLSKAGWKQEFKQAHWRKGYYQRLGPLERMIFRWMVPHPKFSKPHG
ncbi:MAG: HAD-IA family hydrolase [Oceanipulchritudo sp.]